MISRLTKTTTLLPFVLFVLILAACAMPASAPAAQEEAAAAAQEAAQEPAATEEAVEEAEAAAAEASESTAGESTEGESSPAEIVAVANAKLNLNSVTGDELQSTIPDFGDRMVREFHEYRPYVSIQEFRREMGKYIDEAAIAGYEQYVYVPVSANDSDAATLMQIPGLDEVAAEALMAARPFESNDAFLAAVAETVSAEVAGFAAGFLTE